MQTRISNSASYPAAVGRPLQVSQASQQPVRTIQPAIRQPSSVQPVTQSSTFTGQSNVRPVLSTSRILAPTQTQSTIQNTNQGTVQSGSTVLRPSNACTVVTPSQYSNALASITSATTVAATSQVAATSTTTSTTALSASALRPAQGTSQVSQPLIRTLPAASIQQAQPLQPVLPSFPAQVISTETRPHTLAGPAYTQGAYETKHQDDPQLQNLKELRKTSGLKFVPVEVGLSTLKSAATDGKLSRETFVAAYARLLESQEVELPTDSIQNAVFDLFDRDENHVVDMMELICGISLLCSGSEDDKIHAVFNVFDENGDGFISMDEMFKFLTSVFKVVLTPNVMGVMNSMGVTVESAEDLASVTALECFKTADLNQDGKLSVTEFKSWFYAPRNDPSFLFSPVRKLLQ